MFQPLNFTRILSAGNTETMGSSSKKKPDKHRCSCENSSLSTSELELNSAFSFAKRLFSESFSAGSAIVFQCKLSLFPFFFFLVSLVSFLSSWFPDGNNPSGSTAKNVITKGHKCCLNFRIKRVNSAYST